MANYCNNERDKYYFEIEEENMRVAQMLRVSRGNTNVSQVKMATELGVSRKTIQNWEKGTSIPTVAQCVGWFTVLGVTPLPYLFQYLFPSMEKISGKDSDKRIRDALRVLTEQLPPEAVRQLMYLFYGDHGSSPRAILQLVNAHLQTPMKDRVTQASVIVHNYEIAKKKGNITDETHIQPNLEYLKKAVKKGEEAFLNGKDTYISVQKNVI